MNTSESLQRYYSSGNNNLKVILYKLNRKLLFLDNNND